MWASSLGAPKTAIIPSPFFPVGDIHLLTHGRVEKQRFVPTWGIPPSKRVYGFRTDVAVEPTLQDAIGDRATLRVPLTLEAHYHGDTVLCAFGSGRDYLLGYREGIDVQAWRVLEEKFGDHLIALNIEDAQRCAAKLQSARTRARIAACTS